MAMFEAIVTGSFSATHQLRLADGTLEPLHTHDWNVRVTFAGDELETTGWLVDFTTIRARLAALLTTLRDRNLGELPAFARCNPSAELVARHIAEQLSTDQSPRASLTCVEVEEEPGCFARFIPS